MSFGLSPKTLELILSVLTKHPEVEGAKIFGSRAIGNYRENSDIDLALQGNIPESLVAKIALELEELPLLYQFDLVCLNRIDHPGFLEHIAKYGKKLY